MNKTHIGNKSMMTEMDFDKSGISTFYVRFFDAPLEEDFLRMVDDFNRQRAQLVVYKEDDHYYKVVATQKKIGYEVRVWDIVMHKYLSYSHTVMVDEEQDDQKYYPIRFSASEISENYRKLAA